MRGALTRFAIRRIALGCQVIQAARQCQEEARLGVFGCSPLTCGVFSPLVLQGL